MEVSDAFEAWLNPLEWIEAGLPDEYKSQLQVDERSLLRFLSNPSEQHSLETALRRYASIDNSKNRILVAPNHPEFLEKLIWPLRSAKSSFVVGNFISTIAQCGMVGEMVALLWYEISKFTINSERMNDQQEIKLFGSRFEKLGQERRVDILRGFGLIDEEQEQYFDQVRTVRRRYLHFYSQSHESIEKDALATFDASLALVANLLDISLENGKIGLRPALMRYVEKHEPNRVAGSGPT